MSDAPPPDGTLERWAWDYVTTTSMAHKFAPGDPPDVTETDAPPRRIASPGRPAELVVAARGEKSPSVEALRDPKVRARLVHTFLHHELQAAELMAWTLLAFPDAPSAYRRGLVGVLRDELRHMEMYRVYLSRAGAPYGTHRVRDWFWQRVPSVRSPADFCAVMGIGFEGANLDHTARFAARFRAVGDEDGARMQEVIGDEEVPHVRFAMHWFQRFGASLEFASWVAHLPPPLSPVLMRGLPLDRAQRRRAGFDDAFLDALEAFVFVPVRAPCPAPGC